MSKMDKDKLTYKAGDKVVYAPITVTIKTKEE